MNYVRDIFASDVLFLLIKHLNYKELQRFYGVNSVIRQYCISKEKELWQYMLTRDFPKRRLGYGLQNYTPKVLYQRLTEPSQIIELSETDVSEVYDMFPEDNLDNSQGDLEAACDMSDHAMEIITSVVLKLIDAGKISITPGDIIHFSWAGDYRNDGKFLWDGQLVLELDIDIDEFGHIPKDFKYPEYAIDHFHRSINHNNIIWLSDSALTQILENYNEKTFQSSIYDAKRDLNITFDLTDEYCEDYEENPKERLAKECYINCNDCVLKSDSTYNKNHKRYEVV